LAKQITVIIPSVATLKNCVYNIPQTLPDKELIRKYGQLKAANSAWINGNLPASYYNLSIYGRVPVCATTLSQLTSTIEEYKAEIEKRNLFENFELTISCITEGKEKA
jgi:hypothetical protein